MSARVINCFLVIYISPGCGLAKGRSTVGNQDWGSWMDRFCLWPHLAPKVMAAQNQTDFWRPQTPAAWDASLKTRTKKYLLDVVLSDLILLLKFSLVHYFSNWRDFFDLLVEVRTKLNSDCCLQMQKRSRLLPFAPVFHLIGWYCISLKQKPWPEKEEVLWDIPKESASEINLIGHCAESNRDCMQRLSLETA